MKNIKKVIILIICLSLCISLILLVQIYAKYLTSVAGSTDIPIAKWNILVNNQSIKDNPDISKTIQPVFPGNDNIAENIIAPTAEGYFDLNFDFTDTDVSFKYTISLSSNPESSVTDLVATGYSIDNGNKIEFDTYDEDITDTILLSNPIETRSIRIYVLWNDDSATASMNNIDDTLSTKSNKPVLFDVNISFEQIVTP